MSTDLDAEGYEEKNPLGPGKPVPEGFQDPAGAYPRRDRTGQPDASPRARGVDDEIRLGSGRPGPRAGSSVSREYSAVLGRSDAKAKPEYPHNQTVETASGHLVEYDDTPGYERIRIRHRTGSEIEMLANGDVEIMAKGSRYSTIVGSDELVVRGLCRIVVEGGAEIRVQGDVIQEVQGDLNQVVGGDWNLEVLGDFNHRVQGDKVDEVVGSRMEATRGNVIRRNLSNMLERTVGDHRHEIGGTYRITAQGTFRMAATGQLTARFAGGVVDLNGPDEEGVAGSGVIVATTFHGTEYHGEAIYGDEFHAGGLFADAVNVDGSLYASTVHAPVLEGTAKRAQWATTAGSAPDGPSTPVTASPTSPTGPTAKDPSPAGTETVEPVLTTSDGLILALDRTSINGRVERVLATHEATRRLRSPVLLTDPVFLRELIDTGAITDDVVRRFNGPIERRRSTSFIKSGRRPIVSVIPTSYQLSELPSRSTPLSPKVRMAHALVDAELRDQAGLSAIDIARNCQFAAYNLVEPLLMRYGTEFTLSEWVYNPLETEVPRMLAASQTSGLCVGLQMRGGPRGRYFEVANWIADHLVFDRLTLSYISYDPSGLNEPTLLVELAGTNRQELRTEYNHRLVEAALLDLADDDA